MTDRKRCCTCGEERPLSSFNKRATAWDGLQSRCRSCCRAWYDEHGAAHKINVRVRNARHRHLLYEKMAAFFATHHCVDCGESDVRCLEFDHRDRDDKEAAISNLLKGSMPWQRILREIAKCDVRCANCHRKRTAAQFNNWRHQAFIRAMESARGSDTPMQAAKERAWPDEFRGYVRSVLLVPPEPRDPEVTETMTAEPTTTALPDDLATPQVVDRDAWLARIDELRTREKAHTREGDAIAAARRRLPMTEVDASLAVDGPDGPVTLLELFEGRRQLYVYFHMWHEGQPAEGQCEGCTFFNGQVRELSYLHARDVTYATVCEGPFDDSNRYREFMGWDVPWYSAGEGGDALLDGRGWGLQVCYLREGDRVFETYWTTGRGAESMAPSYPLLDQTVYGRQEDWEDSPGGWPKRFRANGDQFRTDGRPSAQWSRLAAGRSDDINATQEPRTGHCH